MEQLNNRVGGKPYLSITSSLKRIIKQTLTIQKSLIAKRFTFEQGIRDGF